MLSVDPPETRLAVLNESSACRVSTGAQSGQTRRCRGASQLGASQLGASQQGASQRGGLSRGSLSGGPLSRGTLSRGASQRGAAAVQTSHSNTSGLLTC